MACVTSSIHLQHQQMLAGTCQGNSEHTVANKFNIDLIHCSQVPAAHGIEGINAMLELSDAAARIYAHSALHAGTYASLR